jgi:GT2 family glycosyltransferase
VANGDIVSYLDTDDVYEPGAFQKVAEIFLKQPDLMWVCGKCRYIDEHEKEIRKIITYCKNYWLKRYSYKKLLIVNFIPQPSTFWRKQLINEIGPFDINIHLVNDYEYGLRAGAKYNPGLINSYLARQRMHPEQLTAKDVSGQLKETLFVARKYTSSKIILAMNFSFISCISLTYSALNQVRAFNKS